MKQTYLTSAALLLALTTPAFAAQPSEVVDTYADIAAAKYADSLRTAEALQAAGNARVGDSSGEAL
mgnify:CR=1 FL=1